MTIPAIGVHQADAPFWGTPPRVQSTALVHWRHVDGQLVPLTGQAVERTPPTTPVALRTSIPSVTRVHAPGLVGWEPRPWDDGAGGTTEETGAHLADDEAWAIASAGGGPLRLAVQPMTVLAEWTEVAAWAADTVVWALATRDDVADLAAATGAFLALTRTSTNALTLTLDNGVAAPVSATVAGVGADARVSARALLVPDAVSPTTLARVQLELVRNGGAAVLSALSAAVAWPAAWGDADDAVWHVVAPQWLRTLHVRAGTCSRAECTATL